MTWKGYFKCMNHRIVADIKIENLKKIPSFSISMSSQSKGFSWSGSPYPTSLPTPHPHPSHNDNAQPINTR